MARLVVSRIRVEHLLVGYTVGGLEVLLKEVLPLMDPDRFEIRICALKGWDLMADEFRDLGLHAEAMGGRGRRDARIVWRLLAHLRASRPDILHTHTYRATYLGALLKRAAGIKRLAASDHEIRYWLAGWQRLLERWMRRAIDGMVVPSQAVRLYNVDRLRAPPEGVFVIPNGIQAGPYLAREPGFRCGRNGKARLAYVGRLHDETKDISGLVRALDPLLKRERGPKLILAGEGPSRGRLERFVRQMGLEAEVAFIGLRRDLPAFFQDIDMLILPSRWEGFGMVLLEAMAAGVPVVATRAGGIQEVVEDGRTGLLVPPGDPAKLREAVETLLDRPALAEALARKGRQTVIERFRAESVAEKLADFYLALYGERRARSAP